MAEFEIYKDARLEFRRRFKANNGKILAESPEGYNLAPQYRKRGKFMEEHQYAVGDRVEKLCVPCGEERGHVVVSLNKRGQISRVNCPQCGIKTAFKKGKTPTGARPSTTNSAPYDWTRTYRKGQTMTHPTFGFGEVTAVIEPQKIDVLFSDKVRRLIHARPRS
jgi:hypothetical protein